MRPYFQKTRALTIIYDVITCIATGLCMAEGGVPFQLLELRLSIDYWRYVCCESRFTVGMVVGNENTLKVGIL